MELDRAAPETQRDESDTSGQCLLMVSLYSIDRSTPTQVPKNDSTFLRRYSAVGN